MDLTLCSTEEQLSRALTPILHSPYLVLDCEGRALGLQGGALSLLSIGTSRDEVFLVDVLGVPRETDAMRRLLALLGDPDVVKIMWDGRMDAVALRETYGVALAGVLDIQLAEVVSRAQARGEEDDTRLERLMFAVGRRALSTPKAYSEMHSLAGLDGCLRLFRVGLEHTKSEAVKQMHRADGGAGWMERPVAQDLLSYAAHDIRAIASLHDYFSVAGWMPSIPTLLQQSARYISIHDRHGPVDPADTFRKGPFLPLDVLTARDGEGLMCKDCNRQLSKKHFHKRYMHGKYQRLDSCRVCEATKTQALVAARRAEAQTENHRKQVPSSGWNTVAVSPSKVLPDTESPELAWVLYSMERLGLGAAPENRLALSSANDRSLPRARTPTFVPATTLSLTTETALGASPPSQPTSSKSAENSEGPYQAAAQKEPRPRVTVAKADRSPPSSRVSFRRFKKTLAAAPLGSHSTSSGSAQSDAPAATHRQLRREFFASAK